MQTQIDELLNNPSLEETLSCVILAARGEQIIAHRAYGFANRSWMIPNTTDTIFRIASITKFFTAVLTIKLVEDRLIDLAAPILTYLPDYRADTGSRITIHHLLSHTSGLTHYPVATPGFMQNEARRSHDVHEFARLYCSGDLQSEPGESFHYSNDNYHLLGLIIEAVTGKSYSEAIGEYILQPAGMDHSGLSDQATILPKLAQGYDWKQDHYENAGYVEPSAPWAAGGLYSAAEDLFKFYRALETGRILKPESFDLICTPQTTRRGQPVGYNCILASWMIEGCITVPGSMPGFDMAMWFIRRNQSFVVLLMNAWGRRPEGLPGGILKCLADS